MGSKSIKKFKLPLLVTVLLIFLGLRQEAQAESSLQFLPAGIVFPEYTHAIAVDSAAMSTQAGSALQLEYGPATSGSSETTYNGSYTYTNRNWGLGVGYNGWQDSSSGNTLTDTLVVGGSVKVPSTSVSLGLSMASSFLNSSFSPTFDASAQIEIGSGTQIALIFYDLPDNLSTVGLGMGHRESDKYSLEGGFYLPSPSSFFDSGSRIVHTWQGRYFLDLLERRLMRLLIKSMKAFNL